MGGQIVSDRFHVSKLNVREAKPFGESEADKALIEQLRFGKIIGPFKARPEGNGYGVYVGRRRFLAKRAVGVKVFIVGQDCIIENISEDDAREASLIENLQVLREEMDPITRARSVADIIDLNMVGLRAVSRKLGIPPSTLSEWTKVLALTPSLQQAVAKGDIKYTDALILARMSLGELEQEELAEILKTQGIDAFQRQVQKLIEGKTRRGAPKGKYVVLRTTFDRISEADMQMYEKLNDLAKAKNMKIDAYCKWVLGQHVKTIYFQKSSSLGEEGTR